MLELCPHCYKIVNLECCQQSRIVVFIGTLEKITTNSYFCEECGGFIKSDFTQDDAEATVKRLIDKCF